MCDVPPEHYPYEPPVGETFCEYRLGIEFYRGLEENMGAQIMPEDQIMRDLSRAS